MPPDKNLPSTLSLAVAAYQPTLQKLWDCWNDLDGVEKIYLPQETKEPPRAYGDRLKRTSFDNRFRPAINDYAGLLSIFSLSDDVAQSILENKDNIDGEGNDIWSFFHEADQMTLRDGWCAIKVEFPPADESIQSQADLIERRRRPYLVAIARQDILNWRLSTKSGMNQLERVTIRERRLEPDGDFGELEQIYYRVLTPGEYAVYQIIDSSPTQSSQLILVESGTTTLDEIPLIYYSVTESQIFSAKAPFLNLAKLNIEYYQKRSQLNEVLRKCNLPVPVRKGLIRMAADLEMVPPLVLGPNSVVDIPENGDFFFAEPSGSAIAATREDLQDLTVAMDRITLSFLTSGDSQKTATEVVLDSTKVSASLKGVARRKESAAQQVFQLWTKYTGEATAGNIVLDDSLLQMPLDPQAVDKLESLAQTGFISQRTLLLLLQRGKILPNQFDVNAELAATGQSQEE